MNTAFEKAPHPQQQKLGDGVDKKRVILIAGPTAAGKTGLSLKLAQAVGGEIISADSMQVYRGMDIGTAKATAAERTLIAHHLLDIRAIDEPFNVANFYDCTQIALTEIAARDNVPLVVGGSGFYIHTLLYGPPPGPPSSPDVRDLLERQMREMGPEVLYERLQLLDPEYAATISERDRHKIIRALEIIAISEQKVSDFVKPATLQDQLYDFRCWFIYYPRETLYQRIDTRCDQMIERGLMDEVKDLDQRGIRLNSAAAQAIGYAQALRYLDSAQTREDWEEFVGNFKKASRHFAKRQFTWFRKEPLFRWVNLEEYSEERVIETVLQDFEQGW